jgi:ribosomal protein S18 acetylase RimI-like enzyme
LYAGGGLEDRRGGVPEDIIGGRAVQAAGKPTGGRVGRETSMIEIRQATTGDVAGVLPMVEKIVALHAAWDAAKYEPLPDAGGRYDRRLAGLARDRKGVFLVAERQAEGAQAARLVGFIIGTVERTIPIYRLAEYGFLHDLWVEEEYRNEGVGRQLAMRAVERFREIGVEQVRLDTAACNEAARKLFEQCGFRPSSVEMLLELKMVS